MQDCGSVADELFKADRKFEVNIQRASDAASIGLRANLSRGSFILVEAVSPGLIGEWNATSKEDEQIQRGDCIVAVNNKTGEASELLQIIQQEPQLTLTVARPRECEAKMSTSSTTATELTPTELTPSLPSSTPRLIEEVLPHIENSADVVLTERSETFAFRNGDPVIMEHWEDPRVKSREQKQPVPFCGIFMMTCCDTRVVSDAKAGE